MFGRSMALAGAGLFLILQSAPAQAAAYSFSQASGTVGFDATASLHSFKGKAKAFSGTFDPEAGTGTLTVDATSMSTGLGPRDTKMHGFCLESKTFATITFTVTGVEGAADGLKSGEGSGRVTLKGSLKIRDATKSVSVPADYAYDAGELRLSGSYKMKWTDYNVPDPSIIISTLYPDMVVKFDVKMAAQ